MMKRVLWGEGDVVPSGDEETAVNDKLLRKRTKGRGWRSQSAVPLYLF